MKTTKKHNNHPGARTTAAELEVHEVANLFPRMTSEQYAGLKEDIRKNGQRHPVWTYQSKIIDGRSQYVVCQDLDVPPVVQEWDGNGSLVQFVFTANNQTHHLTKAQRAAVAVDLMAMLKAEAAERRRRGGTKGGRRAAQSKRGQPKEFQEVGAPATAASSGLAADLISFLENTDRQKINDAETLKAEDPLLFDEVRNGKMAIGRAMSILRERKALDVRNERAKAEGFLSIWEQAAAWHEAGHAVVAYVLGHEVIGVTIEPDDEPDEGGLCFTSPGSKQADRAQLKRDDMLINLAGEEAEVKWGGTVGTKIARQSAADDLKSIRNRQPRAVATGPTFLDDPGGKGGQVTWSKETRRRHIEWMRSVTRDILSSPRVWEAVQAVVEELRKNKTLGDEEVEDIISARTGKMQSWQW